MIEQQGKLPSSVKADPICGNCGQPYSKHYFEREIYCYQNTNGDIYRAEPQESWVLSELADRYPELYEQIVQEWKVDNGHA